MHRQWSTARYTTPPNYVGDRFTWRGLEGTDNEDPSEMRAKTPATVAHVIEDLRYDAKLTADETVAGTHPLRHDRSWEHGAFPNPGDRPVDAEREEEEEEEEEEEDGVPSRQVSKIVGMHESNVARWRTGFRDKGLEDLEDWPSPGRPRRFGHDERMAMAAAATIRGCLQRNSSANPTPHN